MKIFSKIPSYKKSLISKKKVVAYEPLNFSQKEWKKYISSRNSLILKNEILIKPKSANYFKVKTGQFFRKNITYRLGLYFDPSKISESIPGMTLVVDLQMRDDP